MTLINMLDKPAKSSDLVPYRLQKFATGRYDVTSKSGLRLGSIIGGGAGSHACWQAESGRDVVGQFPTRTKAADELARRADCKTFFQRLQEIVESGAGWLEHFRDDFYMIDREILAEWGYVVDMLWFVRKSGTHLVQLDLPNSQRAGLAILQGLHPKVTGGPMGIYHLDACSMKVREVDSTKAGALLARSPRFDFKNGCITEYGKTIGKLEIARSIGPNFSQVVDLTVGCDDVPSELKYPVLRSIAEYGQVVADQTLFAKAQSYRLMAGKRCLDFWATEASIPCEKLAA